MKWIKDLSVPFIFLKSWHLQVSSISLLCYPSAFNNRRKLHWFLSSAYSFWANFCIFHSILHSYWNKPAEGSGRGLGDLHPGMSDPGSFWQLLDASSVDPVPDVRCRHSALLRFSAKLDAGDQGRWASHPRQVSAQRWSGQREQPAPVLQHAGETLRQERRSRQGHPSS